MISLSTHVLDIGRGAPAAGVRVELVGVAEATTGEDGRWSVAMCLKAQESVDRRTEVKL